MTASPREDHGVVQLAALDLRRVPDQRAELTSQLLMGEVVRVLAARDRGRWLRVRNAADGYVGWVRSYGIRRATRLRVGRWRALATGRVVAPFCTVHSAPQDGHSLTPLFWNGRVIPGRSTGGRRHVELPDGRRGWVDRECIDSTGATVAIVDRIQGLLGTPYLWGGRTPHGFDCSGFVQQLLTEQGIPLPRDAHEQFRATRTRRSPQDLAFGDLLFFRRGRGRMEHVALVLADGYFVHASGSVRLNSFDPDNPFCDKELLSQIRGFGSTGLGARQTRRTRLALLEP